MNDDEGRNVEVDGPGGLKFRARGYDILTLAVVAGLSIMLYMLFDHTKIAEKSATEASVNARETSRAIREMACIIAIPENQRMDQIGRQDSYCKRIAQ